MGTKIIKYTGFRVCVLLGMVSAQFAVGQTEGRKSTTTSSMEAILQCVKETTGLTEMFGVASMDEVALDGLNVPFLEETLKGARGIKVTMETGVMSYSSKNVSSKDRYPRTYEIYLDAKATRVLLVTTKFEKPDALVHRELTPAAAKEQLLDNGETFHSFLKKPPKITFVDALNVVFAEGIPSPTIAREIDAYCVMYSRLSEEIRPAWVIRLRGIPPARKDVPAWQITAMRNVVDATTGKWLFATNKPYLTEKLQGATVP